MPTPILHKLRPARLADAEVLVGLIAPYVESGLVLPRSAAEVREQAGQFLVAENGTGAIVGCVALRDYGAGLVEIRSLAVAPAFGNHGIGSHLVESAVALAKERGAARIFALTMRPHLFCRLGFHEVAKERWLREFPQKVWNDCRFCRKRDRCDETAVLLAVAAAG
ncbi:MAG: GNAT family N-acetyltransferase [Lentisphaeria bacterium]|jgi:amino-acid N-acetyltransferase